MSRTAEILNSALMSCQGAIGEMITCVVLQRGLTIDKVERWQAKLRKAADVLEDLK